MHLLASDFLQISFNTLFIKLNTHISWEHFYFRIACDQQYKLSLLKTHIYLLHNFKAQKTFTLMTLSTKQRTDPHMVTAKFYIFVTGPYTLNSL